MCVYMYNMYIYIYIYIYDMCIINRNIYIYILHIPIAVDPHGPWDRFSSSLRHQVALLIAAGFCQFKARQVNGCDTNCSYSKMFYNFNGKMM